MRRLDRRDSEDLFDQMQNMIEEFQNKGMNLATEFTGHTPVDVRQEDEELIISADLPGVQKEDIDIKADGQRLEISAESSQEVKEENEKYLRKERSSRTFRRTLQWPRKIDEETISAEYSDGVLEVSAELEEGDGTDIEVE